MKRLLFSLMLLFCFWESRAQELPDRLVSHDMHSWISINSFIRFSDKWGMMADVHHRRRSGIAQTSFNFLRLGATYWVTDEIRATGGVAILRLAPPFADRDYTDEYRIHHELTYAHRLGKIRALERLRFDHRWRENYNANGQLDGYQFTTRVRFLYSLAIPLYSGEKAYKKPALVIADEILAQFGPGVVYNFFEQNRFFLGIRQRVSETLAFDTGYMYVFQQTAFGNQLNAFHTLRLFFYWTPDFRKQKSAGDQVLPVEKLMIE
jgi:hypothetical protein